MLDKWRKNRLFNLPPQHRTLTPLVAKEHPRRMTERKWNISTWRSITSGTVRSSPKCSSWLFVVEVPIFSHNKWRKGPVEPKCRHTGTKLPSGSGSTSGGAFRSSQNLGSGGTCDTKHAVRSF